MTKTRSKAPLLPLIVALFAGFLGKAPIARANEMALGVAADEHLTFSSTSLTGLLAIDPADKVQGFFSIAGTSPFDVNFAGLFKHTIVEGQGIGLHLGGGLGLGSATAGATDNKPGNGFAFSLTGIAGVHFYVPGLSKLAVHLDAGPVFSTVNGNSDFRIGALSSALGLSVFYVF